MRYTDLGGMAQGPAMVTILPGDSDAGGLQTTRSRTLPCNKAETNSESLFVVSHPCF